MTFKVFPTVKEEIHCKKKWTGYSVHVDGLKQKIRIDPFNDSFVVINIGNKIAILLLEIHIGRQFIYLIDWFASIRICSHWFTVDMHGTWDIVIWSNVHWSVTVTLVLLWVSFCFVLVTSSTDTPIWSYGLWGTPKVDILRHQLRHTLQVHVKMLYGFCKFLLLPLLY